MFKGGEGVQISHWLVRMTIGVKCQTVDERVSQRETDQQA